MIKDTYIRIRINAELKEQIKEEAKRSRSNMSDYIIKATVKRMLNEKHGKEDLCINEEKYTT